MHEKKVLTQADYTLTHIHDLELCSPKLKTTLILAGRILVTRGVVGPLTITVPK